MSSTATESAGSPPASADDTARFFTLALSLCAVALLPPVLARFGVLRGPPERYLAAAPLAVFSPTIAAVLASRAEAGREGSRAFFRQLRAWPKSPLWYALALTLPGLLFTAARAVYALLPGNHGGPWLYLPTEAQHVVGMLVVPVGEELGWRGFALPRLQRRYGPAKASALLGALWGLWHVPMFLASGASTTALLLLVPYFLGGSALFTWFYNRTGGSLPLAILLHVGAHLDAPGRYGSGDETPLVLMTLALLAVAPVLLFVDRAGLRREP